MGLQDNIFGYLKNKNREVTSKLDDISSGLLKTYSFTSIGGGSGSSMAILYLSQLIAGELNKQVCVLDLNLTEPDMLYYYNVDVTTDNTLLNYFKGRRTLEDCFIQDSKMKNIHLITAAPTDDPLMTLSIGDDETIIKDLLDKLNIFDYVLINLPYHPSSITFVGSISSIDKGYVVLDERLSSIMKVKQFLDYMHVFHGKSNFFNNIILNKRTDYEYPYDDLNKTKSDIITEIPFDEGIIQYMNTKEVLYKQVLSKEFQNSFIALLDEMNV